MDAQTRAYRKDQFNKVETKYSEYKSQIKILKPDGETNWLSIEEKELQEVIALLTK